MAGQSKDNPFASAAVAARASSGLISVEQQRAIAQVQAAIIVARSMPRDRVKAQDMVLQDCTDPALAEDAEYEFARGGSKISGPSIRLLETVARRWGNMECGVKELSRREGYSECEAYAWDMESNFRDAKTFHVKHWRDTKQGGYPVTDERDIYETVANQGARRKRACMETVIPRDIIDAAVNQCQLTLKTKIDITPEFISTLLASFDKFGVTKEQIEKRIQRHIDAMTPALAVHLRRIYNSLKDGMSVPAEWFEQPEPAGELTDKAKTGATALKERVTGKKGAPAGESDPTLGIPGAGDISHVGSGAPAVDFVKLKAALQSRTDIDTLDADAALIQEIPGLKRQNELAQLYTKRRKELTK